MSLSSVVLILSVAFLATSATPLNHTSVGVNCIITKLNQVKTVLHNCKNIVVKNLVIDAGHKLELLLKPGTTLTFEGTTTFEYAKWAGPIILIKGSGIHVIGASVTYFRRFGITPSYILVAEHPESAHFSERDHKLDGRGHLWWDGKGDTKKGKPKFMSIQATGGSTIKNINMYDCPHQCVSITHSDNLKLSNWKIDCSAGNPVNGKEIGHNTDGFNIGKSNNINIDSVVVKNQDDCVCINSGTNMQFSNLWCYGGHGLSISAGVVLTDYQSNVVNGVHFEDSHVIDSRNGIHIKTRADGGKGLISDVTVKNIQLSGISHYAINVEQNYRNKTGPSGEPSNHVPVKGFTVNGLTGTMKGSNSVPVYILCASGACSNFQWSKINIHGNSKPSNCNYHPSGFSCK